jgi:DNA primase
MRPEWVSFAEGKSAVSMRLVLEDYGVLEKTATERPGTVSRTLSIHRGEGRDAFHAHLGKNIFHCFACGAGGNVLDLVAELEQCPAREAALRLQRRYMAGALAPSARQPELGEGKLVTEKREGNPVLPFSLPGLVAEHPYVCGRGLSRETASRFEIGLPCRPRNHDRAAGDSDL